MDESTFDIDRSTVIAGTRRFPAQTQVTRDTDTPGNLAYLAQAPGEGFRHHCFDENGHS